MAKASRKKRSKAKPKQVNTNNSGAVLSTGHTINTDAVLQSTVSKPASDAISNTTSNTTSNTASQSTSPTKAKTSASKSKKTRKGRRAKKTTNYTPWVIGGLVLVALLAYPQIQRQFVLRTATGEFAQLVRQGAGDVRSMQVRHRDLGRSHVPFGSEINYNSTPPTTGPHYGSWINPGYYSEEQEPKQLVHSLEHGHVVAYYGNDIPEGEKDMLIDWTREFRNEWAGFIATPFKNAGEGVILTAWRHTLKLDKFDPAIAAAFIDRHRGRGPENPIR